MSSVIVIGGGISGLASAALLAREGNDVTLLEAHPTLGGRAGSWEQDGFRFDTGPSWYLMPEVFDHFYKLLGTSAAEQLNLVTLDPGYRVYFEGVEHPIDVAASREENIQLFESIRRGSGRRLARYLDSAQETYDLAKKYFLYTTFQSVFPFLRREVRRRAGRFVRLLVEPLSSLTRRTVRDDRLRKILGYPAVFLGSSPYQTPSMYHLMSHLDLSEGVLYPIGGFARVIESIADLARAEGVTIIPSARATRIVVENRVATGVDYVDARGRKVTLAADTVVSAVDLHFSETELLEPTQQTYPQGYWDRKTPGPSALLLNLGVTGDLPELEHHTLLFAKDWRTGFNAIFGADPHIPSPASLYVCKPSGVDSAVAPDDTENLFVLVPIPADTSFGKGGVAGTGDKAVEALADTVIAQIADWAGIPDLASRVIVRRTVGPADFASDLNAWRGTALGPAHTLRQSAFFRAGNKSRKVRGLYFVGGSTIPGIGLPMCLISAEVLLKRIHRDKSTSPLAEPIERARDVAAAAAAVGSAPEPAAEPAEVGAAEPADAAPADAAPPTWSERVADFRRRLIADAEYDMDDEPESVASEASPPDPVEESAPVEDAVPTEVSVPTEDPVPTEESSLGRLAERMRALRAGAAGVRLVSASTSVQTTGQTTGQTLGQTTAQTTAQTSGQASRQTSGSASESALPESESGAHSQTGPDPWDESDPAESTPPSSD